MHLALCGYPGSPGEVRVTNLAQRRGPRVIVPSRHARAVRSLCPAPRRRPVLWTVLLSHAGIGSTTELGGVGEVVRVDRVGGAGLATGLVRHTAHRSTPRRAGGRACRTAWRWTRPRGSSLVHASIRPHVARARFRAELLTEAGGGPVATDVDDLGSSTRLAGKCGRNST